MKDVVVAWISASTCTSIVVTITSRGYTVRSSFKRGEEESKSGRNEKEKD
jgi:hypothetical protein